MYEFELKAFLIMQFVYLKMLSMKNCLRISRSSLHTEELLSAICILIFQRLNELPYQSPSLAAGGLKPFNVKDPKYFDALVKDALPKTHRGSYIFILYINV